MRHLFLDPVRRADALGREIDRVLGDYSAWFQPAVTTTRGFNAGEDEDNYYLEFSAPGVDPASWDIKFQDETLLITGEYQKHEEENVRWRLRERTPGKFSFRVPVSAPVDADKIGADYRHGILVITLPKAEAAKPRKIAVKTS